MEVHFSNWSSHFMDGDDDDSLWLFRRSARNRIDLSRWFYRSLFRHCYAVAQPIIRKITGSNDIALGHFCTIGYLFEVGVAKLLVRKAKIKIDRRYQAAYTFRVFARYLSVCHGRDGSTIYHHCFICR